MQFSCQMLQKIAAIFYSLFIKLFHMVIIRAPWMFFSFYFRILHSAFENVQIFEHPPGLNSITYSYN
jgi:hypothetical protein